MLICCRFFKIIIMIGEAPRKSTDEQIRSLRRLFRLHLFKWWNQLLTALTSSVPNEGCLSFELIQFTVYHTQNLSTTGVPIPFSRCSIPCCVNIVKYWMGTMNKDIFARDPTGDKLWSHEMHQEHAHRHGSSQDSQDWCIYILWNVFSKGGQSLEQMQQSVKVCKS